MKLSIGNRVRCISPFDGRASLVDKVGTVVAFNGMFGVCFDGWRGGHGLDGKLQDGLEHSGRWGHEAELELIGELNKDMCNCENRNCNSCPQNDIF